jgi:hypothetical protein
MVRLIVAACVFLVLAPAHVSAQAVDGQKLRRRALFERRSLQRHADRAEKAVKRLRERHAKAERHLTNTERRLQVACAQEAYSDLEQAAARRLQRRQASVKRIRAKLEVVSAKVEDLQWGCGKCDLGCGEVPDFNCACQIEFREFQELATAGQAALERAQRRSRSASLTLVSTVEPTRVAAHTALLRIARRNSERSAAKLAAALRARDAANLALAQLVIPPRP